MYFEFVLKAKIEKQFTIESLYIFVSNYQKINKKQKEKFF